MYPVYVSRFGHMCVPNFVKIGAAVLVRMHDNHQWTSSSFHVLFLLFVGIFFKSYNWLFCTLGYLSWSLTLSLETADFRVVHISWYYVLMQLLNSKENLRCKYCMTLIFKQRLFSCPFRGSIPILKRKTFSDLYYFTGLSADVYGDLHRLWRHKWVSHFWHLTLEPS